MIKVLINGCNGKMGQVVANQIYKNDNFEVFAGVDRIDTGDNKFPVFTNPHDIKEKPDIIIDFSVPIATMNILEYAKENQIPLVIATTGLSDDELKKFEEYSKEIPIFRSANMSYEINLMAQMVSKMATLLTDSDIEIVEIHHNRKIDAPSGTALLLANSINEALDNKMTYEYDRHSKREKRSKTEIGIHAIRGGNVVGKHSVLFFSENESFEITHTVDSRNVFADGALKAAEFLINKQSGLYSMKDMF
ncbi:MAG: 4-hydroxy-tetrahydrodipicolinate reductase [Clostridia bacterium]|nr:4-hydroxy-tetrahydrodipicolinate reductase [Clostridia bacterium]